MRSLARADRVLVVLLGLHVVLKVLLYTHVAGAEQVGDETAYANGARALSNAVRDLASFGPVDGAELRENVVGSGWFMPGMSLVLAPLYLVVPDASTELSRAFLALVSTGLFLFAVLQVRRALGRGAAIAVAVLPGLVPTFVMFGEAGWGDSNAGLTLVVLLVRALEMSRVVAAGAAPTRRQAAALAGWAIVTVYLRSSVLPIVAAIGLLAVIGVLVALRGRERTRALLAGAVGAGVFVAVLLPWSVAASATLDHRVVTTTSVSLATANTFGDRTEFCYGPCDPNSSIWFTPLRYSREVARATGHSEVEIQAQMSAYARRDLTAEVYAEKVLENIDRYSTDPARFLTYVPVDDTTGVIEDQARTWTEWFFQFGTVVVVLALLLVTRGPRDRQVQAVLVKLAVGGLLMQPFVHIAGPRYWTTLAAVGGLALWLLVDWGSDVVRRRPREAGLRSLSVLQGLLAAGAVGAVGLVVVLA